MRSARQLRRTSSYLEMISRTSILLILGVSSGHLFYHHSCQSFCHRHSGRSYTYPLRPPPRFCASVAHAHSHRYLNGALGHENDGDDDEVPSNAERRTSNAERRDARVTSNNARSHDADDATTVSVTMKATMTATIVDLRVVVYVV